jgi:hypothetical protein
MAYGLAGQLARGQRQNDPSLIEPVACEQPIRVNRPPSPTSHL